MVDKDDILFLDAHAQAELLSHGHLTAGELRDLCIARIETVDPSLTAVSHRSFDLARRRTGTRRGAGRKEGIPWLVKDSLPYAGLPAACGSRFFADAPVAAAQYPLADRLDAAGLLLLGKSAVPEFSLLPTTESVLLGATANPWDKSRSAGGSSGGAAAAVAAGMVPVAHAADGGGSIRIPAACCGVVGLKPSRGANLRARGFHLLEDVLVSDAMLTRSVRDTAWFARWLRPENVTQQAKTGPLRIVQCNRGMNGSLPHPAVADAIDRTARLCADLGHRVEQIDRLPPDICRAADLFRTLWQVLARDGVEHCRAAAGGGDLSGRLEPWALGLAERAVGIDPVQLGQAYAAVGDVTRAVALFFENHDLLLSPVVASPPPPLGHLAGTRDFDALFNDMFDYIAYTPLQNLSGTPSISLPLHLTADGLPVGSMLSGPVGSDETLLRLAADLEEACPWSQRRPPV